VAACRQKKKARFVTAAGLVNDLVEAQHHNQLGKVLQRWSRYELIVIDEVGYVPLAEIAAELIFQVISDRAEKAALILTTNLPFSEWTQVFTNTRLLPCAVGSGDGSGAYHRDRDGQLSVQTHAGEEKEEIASQAEKVRYLIAADSP